MGDISTVWNPATGSGDWVLPQATFSFVADGSGRPVVGADGFAVAASADGVSAGGGLVSGRDIETAVLISLHTDAPAGPDDRIADTDGDPRGWWGDQTMGSKLWLLARGKRTPQALLLAKAYAEDALAWLMQDGIASNVVVTTEWLAGGLLGIMAVITQPDGRAARVATQYAWKGL